MVTKKTRKALWTGLIALSMVLLVSFTYNDIVLTTRHGINFWDILFRGRLLHFFQDNVCASGNTYLATYQGGCSYNLLVYICFAIWNLPLWLLEKMSLDVMNSIPCLIWANLLPVFATLLVARYLKTILKIDEKMSEDRIWIVQYLYLSSSLVLTTILIVSRYDSLCSIFMLLSLFGYLSKNNRSFIIWGGIAFCFNFFAILVFLPLLLLRIKSIIKIFGYLLFMLVPYFVTSIPMLLFPTPGWGNLADGLFGMLFERTNGRFSWFIVTYAIILVYSYLVDESKKDGIFPIWISFCSLASLFAFCLTYPYWPVLLSPYVVLLIGKSKDSRDQINILVETVGFSMFVLGNMIYYSWCYVGKTMQPMILSVLLPNQVFNSHVVYDFWVKMRDKAPITLIFHSIFVATMIILAVTNYSGRASWEKDLTYHHKEVTTSQILWIRWITTVIICLLPFLTLIK